MTPRQERAVIRKALAGDRDAAEALVKAHQGSLFAYMLRLTGRPDVAEDVVQEAFVRALTHLERYDPRFRFSTWLFTIAKRLHVNASQRLAPSYDTEAVSVLASQRGSGAEASSVVEADGHLREALAAALEQLTGDQRDAVVLFYQLDWSVEQIAEYLDQPEGTVKSHLHRARRRMRETLEANQVVSARLREVLA
jgi:RNA polymerase sigma-70 factor (ECF subfamily)